MKIDSHQHFWNPARGDYGWMPKDNPILNRPYGPSDLAQHLNSLGIEHTILVQAAPTIGETEYMLGIADAAPFVAGVVGWVDFENPDHRAQLTRFAQHPKFVGVRPMIQDIADVDWMLRPDVAWGYRAVQELDLTFDALGFPKHLDNFHRLLTAYPDMRCVIDHCMKPQIRNHNGENFAQWSAGIRRLAQDTNSFLKLSGLVTEASVDWTPQDLKPYVDVLLDAFGPARMLWGSDWPVCRLHAEYGVWHDTAMELTAHLSENDRKMIFGETAARAYKLD